MRYLLTGKQAQELDHHAIDVIGFPGLVLMEKAAMTLAKILMERENTHHKFLFVCGIGNNGGDGLAAARLLHQQGYSVAVTMIGEADKLSADAQKQLTLAAACEVPFVSSSSISEPEYDILVDGLFGVGLKRNISGVYEKIVHIMNESKKKIYAIDMPSGIHGETGEVMNFAIQADVTVTFGTNKQGLVLYPGCQYAGEVIVGDIGYFKSSYESIKNPAYFYELEDLKHILPKRNSDGHKGNFGRVVVIGGSTGMCGAALLAARAAYESGAGIVKVISETSNRDILQIGIPEALFDSYGDEGKEIDFSVLEQAIGYGDVFVVGPGLGITELSKKIVDFMLEHCQKPMILDGDGLTICDKELLVKAQQVIITPHPKEFSAISGKEITELRKFMYKEVPAFARKIKSIVVGKDARSIVSDGKEVYVNISGNSGMGTGGSGDVLSGIIAAFVAQGLTLFDAAKTGVYVHGLAGDWYTEAYNEYSLSASGLINGLKYVLKKGKA
nr:NAD(P)H-hydrate dehydratase [Eubacterium sp.]